MRLDHAAGLGGGLGLVRLSERAATGAQTPPGELLAAVAGTGVHELAGSRPGDAAPAAGLALALAGVHARPGPVLWVTRPAAEREEGALSARGAAAMGLDPGRLVAVRTAKPLDALWCVEEALRSGAVAMVIAEPGEASFTATRRLSLASEASGVPAVLLMGHGREGATAAQSRWRVAPAPGAGERHDPRAPGPARWRVRLERSRLAPGAVGRSFDVEWDDAALSLAVADRLADRPSEARAPRAGAGAGDVRRAG